MGKTIIAPIIVFIALALQLILGIEIPEEVINEIVMALVNLVAVVFVLKGIIKNHKKDPDAQELQAFEKEED